MGANGSKQFKDSVRALRADDPSCRVLDCDGERVGDRGAKLVADSLRRNRHIRGLKLGDCRITDVGLARLTRVLCSNQVVLSHLRSLDLSTSSSPPVGNSFGDEGARHLSELLSSLHSLRYLRAADCEIGDEGAVFIADALSQNTALKTLDLSHNSISDIGAEQIGRALQTNQVLEGLYLWHNRVFHSGAEALALGLACNKSLKSLGLGCNSIGDEGVKALSLALLTVIRDSQLVWLALGGNQITDKGAEHMAALLRPQKPLQNRPLLQEDHSSSAARLYEVIHTSGLRPLLEQGVTPSQVSLTMEDDDNDGAEPPAKGVEPHLDKTKEREEKEEEIACCPLESLGLGGNQIGDEGVKLLVQALYSNTNLQSLGLADNRIGDSGAASMADLLLHTSSLLNLVLSGNDIHDDGGSKIVAALSQNTSLQKLYLAENPLGDTVGRQCVEVVGHLNTTLQVLDLHNTRMSAPTVTTLVQSMRERQMLHALGTQPVPMEGMKGVHQPPTGNMLAMKDWRPPRPPSFHELLRKRRLMMQTSGAIPSMRHTTVEALGSLPEPQETAQALVVRSGDEEVGRRKSYRRSISDLWKRLSRSRVHEVTSEGPHQTKRASGLRRKTQVSMELRPLDEDHDGNRLIEESRTGDEEGEESFNISMFSETAHSPDDTTLEASHDVAPLEASHDVAPSGVSRGENSPKDTQQIQSINPMHQSSIQDLKASNLSFRSQRKAISASELDPISEDMGEPPSLVDAGETPLLEATRDVGETPLLEATRDVGETPLLEATRDVGETPLLEATRDVGETPLLKATRDVGETPLLEATRDAGETPLQGHEPWEDPIQEDELEVSTFASQNLPLSDSSSRSGHETIPARPKSVSIPKSPSFPHNYERSLDDVAGSGSLKSLTKGRARPSFERRPPTRSPSKSSVTSGEHGADHGGGAGSISGGGGAGSISGGGGAGSISGEGVAGSISGEGVGQIGIQTSSSIGRTGEEQVKRPDEQRNPAEPLRLGREKEEEEVEGFVFDAARRMIASSRPIVNSQDPALAQSGKEDRSIKEQWVIALAKRVGILKMGSFLHNAFGVLQSSTSSYEYNSTHARLLRNIPKNREGAPLPTSHARVRLQLVFEEVGSDYINASIAGPPGLPPIFVITQYPLENTIDDFWRMVWEHRLSIMVLLLEQEECPPFWPERYHTSQHPLVVEGSWVDDALTVQTAGGDGEEGTAGIPGVVMRRFTLSSSIENETQLLTIFQYTSWPQSGVPESPRDVARILHLVGRVKEHTKTIAPTIVMSTLGAGRAGCFCAVGVAYQMLKTLDPAPPTWDKDPNLLDQAIRGLRQLRAGLVETNQQFEACHRILEEAMWGHLEEEGKGEEPKPKGRMWKIFGKKKQAATAFKNARGKNTGGKNTGGKMAKKAKEDEGQNDDMQLMY